MWTAVFSPPSASSPSDDMKKILAIIVLALMLCAACLAEETSVFVQGGGAAKCGGEYYIRVPEGDTDALVRIDAAGKAHISIRADGIGDMAEMGGTLYYLMRTGDTWEIMGLTGDRAFSAYKFAEGAEVSDIGVRDGMVFVLVDERLHILYLKQGLCLQLAGARMAEYALHGDWAYYISLDSVTEHALADGEGNVARAAAGRLCRVNMSTGKTETIIAEGADDLRFSDGRLYFHNYSDRYLMGAGDGMTLEGCLYGYDPATGETTRITGSYDWDYAVVSGSVYVLRQDGLMKLTAAGWETAALLPDSVQTEPAGDGIICFDNEEMTFSIVK